MKIRLDFVTNSSSSSFLIISKEKDISELDVYPVSIKDLIQEWYMNMCFDIEPIMIDIPDPISELQKAIQNSKECNNKDCDNFLKRLKTIQKALDNNLGIYWVAVSNHEGFEDWRERKMIAEAENILVDPWS